MGAWEEQLASFEPKKMNADREGDDWNRFSLTELDQGGRIFRRLANENRSGKKAFTRLFSLDIR